MKLLKVYFWVFALLAIASIIPIAILALDGDSPIFPGLWILMGHTLLLPAHGFIYGHTLPVRWFWWVHVPVVTVLAGAGTLGVIEVGESIHIHMPEAHWAIIVNLVIYGPLFAMAVLYLVNHGRPRADQPNNRFNSDAGKARAG